MSFRKIACYVNAQTGQIVNSRGGSIDDATKPTLFLSESIVFCLSFMDDNGDAYPLSSSDSFELAVDQDFDHAESSPLIILAGNDKVDISGDWSSIDRAAGKISFRVNCNTSEFASKLGTSESQVCYIEIKKFSSGTPSILLQDKCTLRNIVNDDSATPTENDPLYRTAAAQDSIDQAQNDAIAAKEDAGTAAAAVSSHNSSSSAHLSLFATKASLVGSSDIEITDAAKGFILKDRSTGTRYRIMIEDGEFTKEIVS